jgi:hypothetical protein
MIGDDHGLLEGHRAGHVEHGQHDGGDDDAADRHDLASGERSRVQVQTVVETPARPATVAGGVHAAQRHVPER